MSWTWRSSESRTKSSATAAAIVCAALALGLAALTRGEAQAQGGGEPADPPNLVVIMTDDQSAATMNEKFMPWTHDLLVEPGTVFSDFVITTPVCCPSRASFYTGQYAHNNGVFENNPGYAALREKENVLPAWLRDAGYRTALIGKFMHGYDRAVDPASTPAPGYTDWFGLLINSYYGYIASEDGKRERFGRKAPDYVTSVINHRAVDRIEDYAEDDDPFFMHVSHVAPHSHHTKGSICDDAAQPAPRDMRRYSRAVFDPAPPSFNEADVLDKPPFINRLRRLTPGDTRELRRKYRCRAASLRHVDRGVKAIIEALVDTGELTNTIVILTGDNGYFVGEHRIRRGKGLPYEESIVQPLVMRVPSRYLATDGAVQRVGEVVSNIDLAPTLLDLAGASPCLEAGSCRVLDGRSLVPLLEGETTTAFDGRGVLIEYRAPRGSGGRRSEGGACEYTAIRTKEAMYARYSKIENEAGVCVPDLEVEHYDLAGDPFQLENLFPGATPELEQEQSDLRARLSVLERCNGTGRDGAPGSPDCE